MNIKIKHILYSLALAALISASPTYASTAPADDVEVVGGPTQPAAVDDKGKEEAPAGLVVAPVVAPAALLSADDIAKLTNIVAMMHTFYNQLEENKKNGVNTPPEQVFELVFATAPDALGLLGELVNKINGLVQNQDAADGSKMKKFQRCCASCTKGTDVTIAEVQKLLPLVQKYYYIFDNLQKNGGDQSPEAIINLLVQSGVMNDLRNLLKKTAKYHKGAEQKRMAKLNRAAAKHKKAAPQVTEVKAEVKAEDKKDDKVAELK